MGVITFRDVTFSYQESEHPSLRNVSLEIEEGEVVVLCGESGCGKSTVIRLMNGLIPFYYPGKLEGKVDVMGHDTLSGSIYDLGRRVGTVFQNPRSQFFCVDVMSELAFGAENRNIEKDEILSRIRAVSSLLEIDDLLPRNMFQLSGGEKQKIACASVSVTDNPIVVLDEPSSNLDASAIGELKKIIRKWKQKGKTVVIAEHRLEYLKDLATRFIYLKEGAIGKTYDAEDFLKLTGRELSLMGLRTLSYDDLELGGKPIDGDVLELQDFCYTYRKSREPSLIVDRLSLPEASVIGIIGRNGAGKSTFVRSFCGLLKHSGGALWEKGRRYSRKARLNRSFLVMQDVNHQLFTDSVEDEITLSMDKEDPERLQELLEEFDLLEFREKHPMALSGGQKQRVAVASAIASRRDFIVFDEPTSGLDYVHMKQVASSILDLQEKGRTVFLITHDIELIYACCSYVIQLEKGKVRDAYPLHTGTEHKLRNFFLEGK